MTFQKPAFTLSFMPGPTKISDATYADMVDATQNHILEISHRSAEFSALSKSVIDGLRTFFHIPANYHIFFTNSASENWGMMASNLVEKRAHVITNGNFSNIGSHFTSWGKDVSETVLEWGECVNAETVDVPADAELFTVAYNETSTGVTLLDSEIKTLRKRFPNQLMAVDITSNAGVQKVDITDADVWYFSVQKGLGLPSGLGICILSPRAYEKAVKVEGAGANIGGFTFKQMEKSLSGGKYHTISTPNIMNLYLLSKQMERWNASTSMEELANNAHARAEKVYDFFTSLNTMDIKVQARDDAHKSISCLCFEADEETVSKVISTAKNARIAIGTGYGKWKPTGFRIANYPALTDADFEKLFKLFK